jgi:adenosylcobyric acid synthase
MHGALMVCGTSSDAGKSTVTTGLCRLLARRGVAVAPFKGQNMSLNAMVTADGGEIGRAQWVQAVAAGAEPEVAMNPVLLKPTGERSSQVVVMGRPAGVREAADYQASKRTLVGVVDAALASLRSRFDVVVCEGAGSPAEINLLRDDIVNLGLARRAGIPAVLVGDIERGGVFAHLLGTVAILPDELSSLVGGFVINRFRGDPALLGGVAAELEDRCGVPTLGVLPHLGDLGLDAEDSLALAQPSGLPAASPPPGSTWRPSDCRACPTSPTSTLSSPSRGCASAGSASRARWAIPTWSSSAGPGPRWPTCTGCATAGWPARSRPCAAGRHPP